VTTDGASASMTKVAKNPWLIGAAAGNACCSLAVVRAIRKGAQTPEDLIEHVDKSSYALILTTEGRLWQVADGQLWQERTPVQAIGSGADLAIGWLAREQSIDPSKLRRAQRFVSHRRVDCGGGCDVRSFG
jgi:hypothetical protein